MCTISRALVVVVLAAVLGLGRAAAPAPVRFRLERTAGEEDLFQVVPARRISRGLLNWKNIVVGSQLENDSYLAICACVRDELKENLQEWVEYHALLGVGRFMLFDYNSSQPVFTSLEPYVRSGLVDVFFHSSHHHAGAGYPQSSQAFAYEQCIRMGKMRHTWMAFIDADEYIFVKGNDCPSLPAILPQYESFGALGLNWVFFASSGHKTRPAAGNLMSYTQCLPRTHGACTHVKSIVNMRYVFGLNWSPHHFTLSEGKQQVNELKLPFEGPWSKPASYAKIMLYHYFTRSQEEFERKTQRGSATARQAKNMGDFMLYNDAATENCTDALRFWLRCCGGSNPSDRTRWLCSGVASQAMAAMARSGTAGAGASSGGAANGTALG
ncbi:hypothetical protein HYH03_009662 [Edaphochlamys debaryana]|uniref:Glycosyltransferase family 92 protein n=1 Tax=Edaphochlamys debaryana TaxID=47281 RepID=A0A835XVJ2_9CHLO|nr:hypothetical protein HYH03_009662 [Edaphochlamys debaryana]|eukprot:KAG2491927.1 hypothetical protein HYH03_009662 [Edaphochlamys debaryana]